MSAPPSCMQESARARAALAAAAAAYRMHLSPSASTLRVFLLTSSSLSPKVARPAIIETAAGAPDVGAATDGAATLNESEACGR